MTKQRDLKRRVRARQAKTGESYVTARQQVMAERPSAVPVVELIDLTPRARAVGFRCRMWMWPSLAEQVDESAVVARLRDVFVATATDPAMRSLIGLAFGAKRPQRRYELRDVEGLHRFLHRARAGIGGVSDDGTMLALAINGRDGLVQALCVLSHDGLALATVSEAENPLSMMSPHARALYVIYAGARYTVGDRFVIGRTRRGCDLAIKDGAISRRHAEVRRIGSTYFLRDLDSTNGTYFKGMQISNKRIEDGDVFQLGDHELTCVFEAD